MRHLKNITDDLRYTRQAALAATIRAAAITGLPVTVGVADSHMPKGVPSFGIYAAPEPENLSAFWREWERQLGLERA